RHPARTPLHGRRVPHRGGDLAGRQGGAEALHRHPQRHLHPDAGGGGTAAAKGCGEDANRINSEFLSTMSHALRTLLEAIAGCVALIDASSHGPLKEAQAERLERIKANKRHLLTLLTASSTTRRSMRTRPSWRRARSHSER